MTLPLSILDLTPVSSARGTRQTLADSVALAQRAEALGFERVWYAEHHSLPGIASTAPDLMVAHVAAQTERIRLGAGGVMLPNHAAFRIAEAWRLLEAMYPGRIDLGLGRAPGTDQKAALALRGPDNLARNDFPQQLAELEAWGRDREPIPGVFARPIDVPLPPRWILGSSAFSAHLAAVNGFPYAFASHFSPNPPDAPMAAYRDRFQSSPDRPEGPRAILAVAAYVADTEAEAEALALPAIVSFTKLRTGNPILPPTPEEAADTPLNPIEQQVARVVRSMQHIGTADQVVPALRALAERTRADEVMVATHCADPVGRLRSYELFHEAWNAA